MNSSGYCWKNTAGPGRLNSRSQPNVGYTTLIKDGIGGLPVIRSALCVPTDGCSVRFLRFLTHVLLLIISVERHTSLTNFALEAPVCPLFERNSLSNEYQQASSGDIGRLFGPDLSCRIW